MRIAFVHEYLNQLGGAERVLQVLSSLYPSAPIYTLIYDREATGKVFNDRLIRTSFLQGIPFASNYHRLFPLLMPLAIEQFDFSEFDIVISVSSSFAKGIITKPSTKHLCYCLTPPRFLWDGSQRFMDESEYPRLIKKILPPFVGYLRGWDLDASMRVDKFISISNFVKDRVSKYYRRDSDVIYPPVNLNNFYISKNIEDYFFMAGRLVPYKKFDVVIEAFNSLGLKLKIAGIGPEFKKLKSISGKNIEFIGLVSDEELAGLYSRSRAFIFPQEEDFGLTPLEAMASGRPVIAYNKGGAVETVIENKTGVFFNKQRPDSVIESIRDFNLKEGQFNPTDSRDRSSKFSIEVFSSELKSNIDSLI